MSFSFIFSLTFKCILFNLILAKPTEDLSTSAQKSCSIWGWGRTEKTDEDEFPNKLRKGEVDILTADECINWKDTNDRKGWKKEDFHQDVSHI